MAQVPYYGSYYRFTEPPPPEPQRASIGGLDPLSLIIIGAVAWWGWKKGWWTGKSHPHSSPPAALETRGALAALETAA